jgi:rhodanese-related sulfurtransferase
MNSMKSLHFVETYNMKGGIDAWIAAGYPVVEAPVVTRGPLDPPSIEELTRDNYLLPAIPRITAENLKQKMDEGESLVVVNVESPILFSIARIPGALNRSSDDWKNPVASELANLLTLPKDRLIVLYCT